MAAGLEHVGGRQRSLPHGETADFWIPMNLNPASPGGQSLPERRRPPCPRRVVVQANADMDRLSRLHEQRWPDSHSGWRTTAVALANDIVGTTRPVLLAVFGGVACVLLIACGNIACLTLGRSISRTREHAVRAALGASRVRLARELLIEAWLLSLLGACVGIPLAIAGVRTLIDARAVELASPARGWRRRPRADLRGTADVCDQPAVRPAAGVARRAHQPRGGVARGRPRRHDPAGGASAGTGCWWSRRSRSASCCSSARDCWPGRSTSCGTTRSASGPTAC